MIWQKAGYFPAGVVMGTLAIANVDYFHGLGSTHTYFSVAGLDITRADILAALGIGIDFAMIIASLAMAHWAAKRQRINFVFAFLVWLICSAVSGHSLYGWVRTNIADVQAPVAKSEDLYKSIKADIELEQVRLKTLYRDRDETKFHKERARLSDEARQVQRRIDTLRAKLQYAPIIIAVANPIEGFEIALAFGLWLLSALLWPAIYGLGGGLSPPDERHKDDPPDENAAPPRIEGNDERKIIPFTDPKAELVQWLKGHAQPRNGARVKARDLYGAFQKSSFTEMSEQRFYKTMKSLLPGKNRKRVGEGVHYFGFALLESDLATAA